MITSAVLTEEVWLLKKENEELRQLNHLLVLKVEKLERQLWSPKSERYVPDDKEQQKLFAEPELDPAPSVPATVNPSRKVQTSRIPKGPKPLDPALPRQRIQLPDPDLKALMCPESGRPRQPAFVKRIEVLARKAAEYCVKVYKRTVFTSPLKTAPVYSAWPGRGSSAVANACQRGGPHHRRNRSRNLPQQPFLTRRSRQLRRRVDHALTIEG